jgi:hypothetical protein
MRVLHFRVLCEHALYAPVENAGRNLFDIRDPNCTAAPYCYDFTRMEVYCNQKATLKQLGIRPESSRWQPVNELVRFQRLICCSRTHLTSHCVIFR